MAKFIKLTTEFYFATEDDADEDKLEGVAQEFNQALSTFGPVGELMRSFPEADFVQADVESAKVLDAEEIKEKGLEE